MVKLHLAAPTAGRVAILATSAQLRFMNVARPMATRALARQLLFRDGGRVTRMTIEFFVLAGQWPMGVAGVIEARTLPALVLMALATILAEPERMRILACMAAKAGFRHLVVDIAAAMAILAVQAGVRAQQRETGFRGVIELLGLPAGG